MGNIVLVDQVLESGNISLIKKFKLEALISNDVVKAVFRTSGADENRSLKEIFEDFEKQENENLNDNFKKNLIKELNELHTAGLSTPDFFTTDLRETRFEKYFSVVERGTDVGEEYYRLQYMKFFVMYSSLKPFYNEDKSSDESFYSRLAKKLECSDDGGLSVYNFEMGLSMTFSILDELSTVAPAVLEKALRNIYSSLTQLKTGLFNSNDYKFFSREEILTRHRDYLVKLFNDKFTSVGIKEMCIRLIVLIGNLRESGEDYLVVYNLIKENAMRLNIDPEISLNNYFQDSSRDSQNSEKIEFKINEKNSREIEFFTGSEIDPNQNNSTSFAFDKDYIYLDNVYTGMFKIAHKKSIILSPGMVYGINTFNTSSSKRSLITLNNELYMKSEESNPFEKVDKELLLADESEEFKNLLTQRQRKEDDEWNKKILETTNLDTFREQIQRQEHPLYR